MMFPQISQSVFSSFYLLLLAIFNCPLSHVECQQFCSYKQGNSAASALESMVTAHTNKPLTIESSPGERTPSEKPRMGINCDSKTESSCYALFTSSAEHKIEIISAGCLRKNASKTLGGAEQCQSSNCTASLYNMMRTNTKDSSSSNSDEQAMTSSKTGGGTVKSLDEKVKKLLKYGFCCCSAQLCNQNVMLPKVASQQSVKSSPTYRLLDTSNGGANGRGNEGDEMISTSYIVLSFFASLSLMGLLFLFLRYLHSRKMGPHSSSRRRHNRGRGPDAAAEHSLIMLETQQMGHPGTNGECCILQCSDHLHHNQCSQQQHKTVDSSNVKLLKLIGNGRYGTVWHALMGPEQEVAVKLYRSEHKLYFDNEMHIYQTPLMNHPNIVNFFAGSWKLNEDTGLTEYMLVMAYIPSGSLLSYLRCTSAVDFSSMCKLAHSAAKGLAYLHSDVTSLPSNTLGGITLHKPAIVHRDFNSRNILVKLDGTCALSDLGFAQKVSGAKLYHGSSANLIPDVGTLRYMPPEVLEGSVDLNKCECALKQIDVYALALVLWEITSRCNELHTLSIPFPPPSSNSVVLVGRSTSPSPPPSNTAGGLNGDLPQNNGNDTGATSTTLPPFKLPFEAELGLHPKFDEMKNLVSCLQRRPQFPAHWNTENEVVRCLIDTIEESWDQDSEARLTAACVASRLSNLWTLWNSGNPSLGSSSSAGSGANGGGDPSNSSPCVIGRRAAPTAGFVEIERELQQPLLDGMSNSNSSSNSNTNNNQFNPSHQYQPSANTLTANSNSAVAVPPQHLRLSPIASSSNAATTELNSPSLIPYQSEHETPSPQLPVNNNNAVHYNNSTTRQRVSSLGPSPHIMSSGPVPMPTLTPVQCNSALGGITVQRHVASVSANNPFPCSTPQSTCNNTPVAVTQLQSLTSALPPSLPSAAKTEHDISPVFAFNNSSPLSLVNDNSTPVVATANPVPAFYRDNTHPVPLVHSP